MVHRMKKAEQLFQDGYSCSQSVFAAYADMFGIEEETALKLSASFGGGMGRMREVCGAVSGMFLLAGLETGSAVKKDIKGKKHNYDVVQLLAKEFKKRGGNSIICRELLGQGLTVKSDKEDQDMNAETSEELFQNTMPEERTKEYYQKRPCLLLVKDACEVIENTLLKVSFSQVNSDEGLKELALLANEIWHEHFITILSTDQIDYMVKKFQSYEAMKEQIKNQGYQYYAMRTLGGLAGYFAIREDTDALFLSKLYLHKKYRGRGYAREAVEYMKENFPASKIWLTVNRYNDTTIKIYERMGFVKARTQVTDIGSGFVMDDYIMEKVL